MPWVVIDYAAANWTEGEAIGFYVEIGYWEDGYCENEWMDTTVPVDGWVLA